MLKNSAATVLELNNSESTYTPLHEAAIAGDDGAIEILLISGANRFLKEAKHGNTALHEAAWRGYSRCVKFLCTFAQPQKSNHKSHKNKNKTTRSTEDECHANEYLNTRNAGGFSALHLAAQNGHNQSCREILLAGSDPDIQNNYGDTPLHTSCRYGHAGATRILISAKCNTVAVNLNYDTALHIACAMGRRKLTRILYEVCGTSALLLRNAQSETPREIALRKNLRPIIDILSMPPVLNASTSIDDVDNESSKHNQHRSSSGSDYRPAKNQRDSNGNKKPSGSKKIWSPYGCHYFPDPKTFPAPKLETLPKEPLQYGEQYYLDLAGNIRKGPVGIGHTCYCKPFFHHMEQKISKSRFQFKEYTLESTKAPSSGIRVQGKRDLRSQQASDDAINIHLPRRNDPLRATVVPKILKVDNGELNNNVLPRCRSLELLDDMDEWSDRITKDDLYRSADSLNNEQEYRHEANSRDLSYDQVTSKSGRKHSDTNTSDTNKMLMKQIAKQQHLQQSSPHDLRINYNPRSSETNNVVDIADQGSDNIEMKRSSRKKNGDSSQAMIRSRRSEIENSHWNAQSKPSDSNRDQCSLQELHRLPYRYPNDFDDISVEMENITKLLGSTIDLNRYDDSTPSTCSSACHSLAQKPPTRHNSNDKHAAEMFPIGSNPRPLSALYDTSIIQASMPSGNGIFQNPWIMNLSQGNERDRGNDADDGSDSGKSEDSTNQNDDDDCSDDATDVDSIKFNEAKDDDFEDESENVEELAASPIEIQPDDQLHQILHRTINPGLVSERIKSLFAKNQSPNDCRKSPE